LLPSSCFQVNFSNFADNAQTLCTWRLITSWL
jgi:hypothetical protein